MNLCIGPIHVTCHECDAVCVPSAEPRVLECQKDFRWEPRQTGKQVLSADLWRPCWQVHSLRASGRSSACGDRVDSMSALAAATVHKLDAATPAGGGNRQSPLF